MNTLEYHRILHEIKNTITLINSSMQLLDGNCPMLKSEYYWHNLKHEITYLKNMVLEISKAGNLDQLQKEPLHISPMIEEICQSMKDTYPDLECRIQYEDNLPSVSADPIKLRQAVLNLLKNSAEAQNGAGYIIINIISINTAVQTSISDSGGGIPVDFEDKIFDLFTTTKNQGTGLGLSIAKQIFECHGGTLSLNNYPGRGCTFTFSLPVSGK